MTTSRAFSFSPVLGAALLAACGSEACPVSEGWDAPEWNANTVEPTALHTQLGTLGTAMRETEQGTRTLDAAALTQAYETGAPSLLDATSPAYQPVVEDALTQFVELAQIGPVDLVDASGAWTPGTEGGIFGADSRGINEGGIEVRQIIGKGLYGAAHYHYAAQLAAGDVTPATVETIAAAFGAGPTLSTADTLVASAEYAHTMGYFEEAAAQLAAAHAHASDAMCSTERDEALTAAFRAWEIGLFARFVYYANEALELVEVDVTDENVANSVHELSEGIGLVIGFHGVDADARVATDADIERMMTALGVNIADLGASTTGGLLVNYPAFEAAVREVEAAVAEAFGLTTAEVEAFRVEVNPE